MVILLLFLFLRQKYLIKIKQIILVMKMIRNRMMGRKIQKQMWYLIMRFQILLMVFPLIRKKQMMDINLHLLQMKQWEVLQSRSKGRMSFWKLKRENWLQKHPSRIKSMMERPMQNTSPLQVFKTCWIVMKISFISVIKIQPLKRKMLENNRFLQFLSIYQVTTMKLMISADWKQRLNRKRSRPVRSRSRVKFMMVQ